MRNNAKILIIDDEPASQTIISEFLPNTVAR